MASISTEDIRQIACNFAIQQPLQVHEFPHKGNINLHTYLIRSHQGESKQDFILQQINEKVFTRPDRVMDAMIASIDAQNRNITNLSDDDKSSWQVVELIPTQTGKRYYTETKGPATGYWRMMVRIPNCKTHKSLSEITDESARLNMAREAGRGLGLYGRLTADMDVSNLHNPLPGYRDTRNYYNQFHSVLRGCTNLVQASDLLPEDDTVRLSTQEHFIVQCDPETYKTRMANPLAQDCILLALESEKYCLTLQNALQSRKIRNVAIHGDTKLDNILFSVESGKAAAVVDLDTIMPHTWLSDWGDMVRSLCNVAGETEPDMQNVKVDEQIFSAVADGFLSASPEMSFVEQELMVDAVMIIALELGLRFFTDYLRGDNYFRLTNEDPKDLNLTRGRVQMTLFQRLHDRQDHLRSHLNMLANRAA
ncbi:MAG: phosphotransferase [Chthonomonadales bacterium]